MKVGNHPVVLSELNEAGGKGEELTAPQSATNQKGKDRKLRLLLRLSPWDLSSSERPWSAARLPNHASIRHGRPASVTPGTTSTAVFDECRERGTRSSTEIVFPRRSQDQLLRLRGHREGPIRQGTSRRSFPSRKSSISSEMAHFRTIGAQAENDRAVRQKQGAKALRALANVVPGFRALSVRPISRVSNRREHCRTKCEATRSLNAFSNCDLERPKRKPGVYSQPSGCGFDPEDHDLSNCL